MNTRNKSHYALMTFTYHIVNEIFDGLKAANKANSVSVESAIETVFNGANTLEPNISNLMISASLGSNNSLIDTIVKPTAKTISQYVIRNERMPSHIVVREAILSKLMAKSKCALTPNIRGLRASVCFVDEVAIEME